MSWWEALVLGIVQGATEFLPVSSSGHLVVAQELLGIAVRGVLFEVTVHLATLVSILLVYRERVGGLLAGVLRRDQASMRYAALLVVATVPAAVVGLAFEDALEGLFENPLVPAVAFLVTGVILWSSRTALRKDPEGAPGWGDAIWIGLAQAFALVPGISRSGATVVMALWLGIEAREAAAFSFLMAVPAIAGAAVLQLPGLSGGELEVTPVALLVGGIAAAVTGVLAIRAFVALLRRRSFHAFAVYVWLLGATFLAWLVLR